MWGNLVTDVGQTFTNAYNWIISKVSDIGKFFYDPETGSILGINFEQLLKDIMDILPSAKDLTSLVERKFGDTWVGQALGLGSGGNDEEDVKKPASTEKSIEDVTKLASKKEQGVFEVFDNLGRLFSGDDKESVVKYDGLREDVKNMVKAIVPNIETLSDAKQEKYMKQIEERIGMSLNNVDNSTINTYWQTGKIGIKNG